MDLFKAVLSKALESGSVSVTVPGLDINAVMESICYQTLEKIQAVLKDSSRSDAECFMAIEAIILEYEQLDSGCGERHDFG